MSNAIFPAVTDPLNSGWNWKLPLKATPSFNTLVSRPSNNRGVLAVSLSQYPVFKFEMELPGIFGDPQVINDGFQQIIGFYGQMQGQGDTWLFDWPGNDLVPSTSPQVVGIGNGVGTTAVMTHSIGGMTELIQNFMGMPTVYVGGSPLSLSAYSIDAYGNLTLATPPPNGYTIAWSGGFYTRCRFTEDELQDLQLIRGSGGNSLWTLKSLKFESELI